MSALDRAFRPAVLLSFKRVDLGRQFRWAGDVGQVDKLPAGELCAVAEVDVFGQRFVFPAAGVLDGLLSPDARRAIEVEPSTIAMAGGVLDDKVAVKVDRLGAGQQ